MKAKLRTLMLMVVALLVVPFLADLHVPFGSGDNGVAFAKDGGAAAGNGGGSGGGSGSGGSGSGSGGQGAPAEATAGAMGAKAAAVGATVGAAEVTQQRPWWFVRPQRGLVARRRRTRAGP